MKETGNQIFEGQDRVIISAHGLMIQAFKFKPDKLFPTSLPLRYIGYPGISGVEVKLAIDDAEELTTYILKLLNPNELQILYEKLKAEMEE